jgi:predicted ATPase
MGCKQTKEKTPQATGAAEHGTTGAGSPKRKSPSPDQPATTGSSLPVDFEATIQNLHVEAPIYRICLTGGPCAGKSTLLSSLQQSMAGRSGVNLFCVPEAATLLVGGGLQWKDMSEEKTVEFQLALLNVQLSLEDQFYRVAKATKQPSLILSDRGTMDGRAYCTEAQFNEILRRGGWSIQELRDRYDAVVHMVSAAIGAPQFYNLDNPARFESRDEAVKADEKLRQMYLGHPLVRVFDNSTSFTKKVDRVINFIGNVTGHSYPHNNTKRFLVLENPNPENITVPFVTNKITITILNNSTPTEVLLVVKREQEGTLLFFYTRIKKSAQEQVKSEHRINSKEYASLLAQRDPSRVDVVKENISFVYESHYCELGRFVEPQWAKDISIMYVDVDEDSEVHLPPFIKVEKDTTKDHLLSSFHISAKTNGSVSKSDILAKLIKPASGAVDLNEVSFQGDVVFDEAPSAATATVAADHAPPFGGGI